MIRMLRPKARPRKQYIRVFTRRGTVASVTGFLMPRLKIATAPLHRRFMTRFRRTYIRKSLFVITRFGRRVRKLASRIRRYSAHNPRRVRLTPLRRRLLRMRRGGNRRRRKRFKKIMTIVRSRKSFSALRYHSYVTISPLFKRERRPLRDLTNAQALKA